MANEQVIRDELGDHIPCEALRQLQLQVAEHRVALEAMRTQLVAADAERQHLTDQTTALIGGLEVRMAAMERAWSAKMDALKDSIDEKIARLRNALDDKIDALHERVADLAAAGSRQYAVQLSIMVSGLLAISAGLLYIILNHALLPY